MDILNGKIDPETAANKFRYTDFHRAVSTGMEQYKKTGSLFALEREIDNHLMETVKKAKYKAFGIEPLIGFAIAKEIEIKLIRLILVCKQLHVKTEEIKERLRLPYV
jgi:V/A-type H+-transporting ATPase subunit C